MAVKQFFLFLDIDGVFNSKETRANRQFLSHSHLQLFALWLHSIRALNSGWQFAPVLSSNWRKRETPETILGKINFAFSALGASEVKFVAKTPIAENDFRGDEIRAYLAGLPNPRFLIFDDKINFHPDQIPRLILSRNADGITAEQLALASERATAIIQT